MASLTRQRTLESVLSWWSDNNTTGATINIHAAAKPLMRFLYHRAVLDFIAKPRDVLTIDDMEIYSSYLAYKYVSPATKCSILVELAKRAKSHVDGPTIANSMMVLAPALLASPDGDIRRLTFWVFSALAYQDRTETAVSTYTRLAACLGYEDSEIVFGLVRSRIALFHLLADGQITLDQKVEIVKGFIWAVSTLLGTCEGKHGTSPRTTEETSENAYWLAITAVEEYKHEFEADTRSLLSNLERALGRGQWLQTSEPTSIRGVRRAKPRFRYRAGTSRKP